MYGGGRFIAVASYGTNLVMYSTDGINWTGVPASNESGAWQSTAYGDGKYVAISTSSSDRVMVLEAPEEGPSGLSSGLYYEGALIATETNLAPLFDKVNNLSQFASQRMTFLDSDPTRPQGGDSYDSAQAILTSPRSGQLWYNTATNILAIRDQGVDSGDSSPRGWKSVVNPESVKAIIDSGYVQHRFQPGTLIAGGRVVASGAAQTWTDSDGWPSRYVKSLWGIKDIDYLTGGVFQFFFDSAVNTALVDSYSYVVQSTIDYRGDDPGGISGSQRTLNVLRQDSNSFTLVLERGDGDNENYGSTDDATGDAIDGSIMNFTVTKAI